MTRARTVFRCRECGAEAPQWMGWCAACGATGTLGEEAVGRPGATASAVVARSVPVPIAEAVGDATEPVATGDAELDRVLGGGLVPGSVTVLGGEPGVGKSTLLLQALASVAERSGAGPTVPCLYVTAEESARQVALRAERLGVRTPSLWLVAETSLPAVIGHIDALAPQDRRHAHVDALEAEMPVHHASARQQALLVVQDGSGHRHRGRPVGPPAPAC